MSGKVLYLKVVLVKVIMIRKGLVMYLEVLLTIIGRVRCVDIQLDLRQTRNLMVEDYHFLTRLTRGT